MVSCGDFGDLNDNPNEPIFVGTETLLTGALKSVSSMVNSAHPVLYVQHMSEITYTEDSRYQATRASFDGWYTGALANLQKIIILNSDPETSGEVLSGGSNTNQIAVARIAKAMFYNFMVGRWGPIPFSASLQGNDNLLPEYDDEESIYNALLTELKRCCCSIRWRQCTRGYSAWWGYRSMESICKYIKSINSNQNC